MLKVAITGNIASGKSVVENFLSSKGFKVYDTDKIAHCILEKSEAVKNEFGTTNRKEIAKVVFSDCNKMKILESIIHPEVKKEIQKIFTSNEEIVFISIPQLFEVGYETLFDKIIIVTTSTELRLSRLMARNNLTEEEALKRINAQISDLEKIPKSDFVIYNNSDLSSLETQLSEILSILVG